MTVSRMSLICWIVFAIMCAAFLPLTLGLDSIHVLPDTFRLAASIALVGVLWWGPFAYAMYLGMAVTLNGDRRLLRRGARGTAVVLRARATNTFVQKGGGPWQASRVYRYRLRVSIPGRSPYETDCAICAAGIREGSTVGVAVSRHNHRRVTIDVGQGGDHAPRDTGVTTYTLPAGAMGTRPAYEGLSAGGYEAAGSWAGPRTSDPIGHQEAENDAFERAEPDPGEDHRHHRG